jgi:hypothetical protein
MKQLATLNNLRLTRIAIKRDTKPVRCIPPSNAAARDEDPRLIPLHEKTKDQFLAVTAEYYIALADKLLHRHRHK